MNQRLPPFITKANAPHWETIESRYKAVASDLQGPNAYRYGSTITHGNQEFMEALSFQYYIEHQRLISYDEARDRLMKLGGENGTILLTPEDYVLGIFDMTGELMRFAVTAMATGGKLPGGEEVGRDQQNSGKTQPDEPLNEQMDVDEPTETSDQSPQQRRDILADLRELRIHLETFEPPRGMRYADDVEKKLEVMQQSVSKVENGFYSLIIRGRDRPSGSVPDFKEQRVAGQDQGIASY